VKDSIAQGSNAGPIWHTHFVRLGVDTTGPCNNDSQVQAITFEQPDRVVITGNTAIFNVIPSTFRGTDTLTGKLLSLTPGHKIQNVVSFELVPHFSTSGALQAVCVTNISPAQQIVTNPITIGN